MDVAKARTRDSHRAFRKLTEQVDGGIRFVKDPPLLVPLEDLVLSEEARHGDRAIAPQADQEVPPDPGRRAPPPGGVPLFHMARKVVGRGQRRHPGVGAPMMGVDERDPLILQAKEAQASVLERFAGRSAYEHHGRRVVVGQRLMQTASDIFLGWQHVKDIDGHTRDYYVRQLHDWKGSAHVDSLRVPGAIHYARMCGATLARAHARSGDWIAIAAYLGGSDRFDRAIADFSSAYADSNT